MRKKLLIALCFIILFPVIALVSIGIFENVQPKASYADLLMVSENLSEDQNAFFPLEKAAQALKLSEQELSAVSSLLQHTNWNTEEAAALLRANSEALRLFDQSAKISSIEVPSIKSFEQEILYAKNWKTLAQLQALQARYLFESDKQEEAFDQLVFLINHGHRFQDSGGGIIHYLVGLSVKGMAYDQWTNFLGRTGLQCEQMSAYRSRLDPLEPNLRGLSNAVKLEFQLGTNAAADLRNGIFPGNTKSQSVRMMTRLGANPFLSQSKTEELFANVARAGLKSTDHPYSEMPIHAAIESLNSSMTNFPIYLQRNLIGKILASMLLPSHQNFFSRLSREQFQASSLDLLHAIHCYKEATGQLPETLTELVPRYLPSVPADSYDGKPIRYSREKRIIYSVGPDLIDSGGKPKQGREVMDHVVFIPF